MKRLFLLIAFLFLQNVFGQITSEEFSSSRLNDKRKIAIYLPEGYSERESYPLFVVLDAASLMEPMIAATRYYEYLQCMPKSIIVGIFNTHTDVAIAEEVGHPMNETAQFFEFIGTELVPYIKGKYPINTLRGIVASEEAAHFASHYLLSDKPLFNALIALNPKIQSYIKKYLPEQFTKARHHKFCYIATTDMENDKTLKEIEDLDIQLKKAFNKNVNYNYEKFTGTSPESADLMGIARGLDLLFDIYKPITAKEFKEKIQPLQENIFQYLGEKYTKIQNELGVKKKPSLNDVLAIYDAIHQREDWLSLSDLSDFVKANGYSDTAMPNFFLGEYYEKIEEYKKATRAYQKAYGEPSIDFINSDLINDRITNLRGK
ncbi:esterase [Capnocytophaga stomatis]|uniref:Esterase n=1 Tax=Capnocytophaga stomatis TaxID=1848904 RepID=A0A250FWW0_9FLAO|nr:alpha/beta hydrolase-fold protein [Capnocytophaga stomatis]ATA89563.1 esterase [Capnocytophaga stomatis]